MTIKLYNDGFGDLQEILERPLGANENPVAVANTGILYTKEDGATVTQLFYRASDGTVSQLTPASGMPSPWNNSVLAGFITENTVAEGVLVGTIVDGSTGTRKLQVQETGTKKGVRAYSALATDNILDWFDTTLNKVGVDLTGQHLEAIDRTFTLNTLRSVAGAGDDLTVQGANAIATAAATAFTGGRATLISGDAASLGAAGADGQTCDIAGGNAASGAGAQDGGHIRIYTGLGAGGGPSGNIVVQDKGGNGINVIPNLNNTSNLGTNTFRFARVRANEVVAGDVVGAGTISLNPPVAGSAAYEAWDGGTVPPVSVASSARMYFDSVSNTLKVSYNTGAYVDLAVGAASPWTRTPGNIVELNAGTDTNVNPNVSSSTTLGLNIGGDAVNSKLWLGLVTASNGISTFNAAGDATRSSFFGYAGLGWGDGIGGAIDVGMQRNGVARIVVSSGDLAGAAGGLFPSVVTGVGAGTGLLGDVTLPWTSVTTRKNGLVVYNMPGDLNPLALHNGSGIALGPGGGGAIDVGLRRFTTDVLSVTDGSPVGSGSLVPNVDNLGTLGTSANRWASVDATGAAAVASGFRAFDTGPNPTAQVSGDNAGGGFVALGNGATTDVKMQRTAATEMTISDGGAAGIDVIPPPTVGMPPPGTGRLGTATNKWAELHAFAVFTGDVIFTDPGCPVCGQEFAEGDDLVMRVIKTSRAPDGGPLTRTVPCHHGCK
jgi:hypothetical protein